MGEGNFSKWRLGKSEQIGLFESRNLASAAAAFLK